MKFISLIYFSIIIISISFAQSNEEKLTDKDINNINNISNIEIKDYKEISTDDARIIGYHILIVYKKEIRWMDNENVEIVSYDSKSSIRFVKDEESIYYVRSPNKLYDIILIKLRGEVKMELKNTINGEIMELPIPYIHFLPWFHVGNWNQNSTSFIYDRDKTIFKISFPHKEEFNIEDIELTELAEGTYPKFSPNRSIIAYLYDDSQLYIIDSNGNNKKEIFNAGDRRITNFKWSPEGDKIAFTDAEYDRAKLKIAVIHW